MSLALLPHRERPWPRWSRSSSPSRRVLSRRCAMRRVGGAAFAPPASDSPHSWAPPARDRLPTPRITVPSALSRLRRRYPLARRRWIPCSDPTTPLRNSAGGGGETEPAGGDRHPPRAERASRSARADIALGRDRHRARPERAAGGRDRCCGPSTKEKLGSAEGHRQLAPLPRAQSTSRSITATPTACHTRRRGWRALCPLRSHEPVVSDAPNLLRLRPARFLGDRRIGRAPRDSASTPAIRPSSSPRQLRA